MDGILVLQNDSLKLSNKLYPKANKNLKFWNLYFTPAQSLIQSEK